MSSADRDLTALAKTSTGSSADDVLPATKTTKYILITHGESYVGYTLAMHLAEELTKREGQLKKKHWRVRVLCQKKEHLKELEKRGVEVKEVDYESQSMIRDQMKDKIKTCIFNPFPKQTACFLEQGNNILNAAKHMKIKRIMMVSKVGCSQFKDEEESSLMRKFNALEEHLRSVYKYGYWAIFRIPFIQQFFYFWSKMIESKSVIGMPISETNMLMTVNIRDVCSCLTQSALSKKSLVWQNQYQLYPSDSNDDDDSSETDTETREQRASADVKLKRVYDLTCTVPVNPLMIAEALTTALKEEGFDSTVEPTVITSEQLETYLKMIAKQEQDLVKIEAVFSDILPTCEDIIDLSGNRRPSNSSLSTGLLASFKSLFTPRAVSSKSNYHGEPDSPNLYPHPSKFLSPLAIQLILDYFRYSRSPFIPVLPSNDVRDITGCDPLELDEFFMINRRQFR